MNLARLLLALTAVVTLLSPAGAQDATSLRVDLSRAESNEAKIVVLEAVLAWGKSGGEREAVDALKILGSALLEENIPVRIHAASLLTGDLGRQPTVELLVKGANSIVRREQKLSKETAKHLKKLGDSPKLKPKKGETMGERLEKLQEFLARSEELANKLVTISEEQMALLELRHALTARLLDFPGDDSVAAITKLIGETPRKDFDPQIDALLELGSRDALKAVIGTLISAEKRYKEFEKREAEARRKLASKKPRSYEGSKQAWEIEKQRIFDIKFEALKKDRTAHVRWAESVATRLRTFAAEHSFATPPAALFPARPWRAWSTEAATGLPRTLDETASK